MPQIAREGIPQLVRGNTLGLSLAIASLLAGCALENPAYVRDTTGAELGWSCDVGHCAPVHESFSPPVPSDCGEDTELLVGAGGLAILCAVSRGADGSDVIHERTCRPLACRDELDCPQWGARSYVCAAGVCQSELALDRVDVTALCLFDVPRHASCAEADADPEVARRMAWVEEACEGGCTHVPSGCLAP